MEIGKESEPYVIEPVEDPVPRERELPQPAEEPVEAPELVPA